MQHTPLHAHSCVLCGVAPVQQPAKTHTARATARSFLLSILPYSLSTDARPRFPTSTHMLLHTQHVTPSDLTLRCSVHPVRYAYVHLHHQAGHLHSLLSTSLLCRILRYTCCSLYPSQTYTYTIKPATSTATAQQQASSASGALSDGGGAASPSPRPAGAAAAEGEGSGAGNFDGDSNVHSFEVRRRAAIFVQLVRDVTAVVRLVL